MKDCFQDHDHRLIGKEAFHHHRWDLIIQFIEDDNPLAKSDKSKATRSKHRRSHKKSEIGAITIASGKGYSKPFVY